MERNLTGDKNIDSIILQNLGDRDLFKICKISKYGNELCKYEPLWYKRLMNKFPDLLQYKNADMSFKNYYVSLVRTMSEILEEQKSEDADYYDGNMDINQWKLIYVDEDIASRIAFKNENTSLIKYLWEKKIIRSFPIFYLYGSIRRGDLDFLSFLLKNGEFNYPYDYEDLMIAATEYGQSEILTEASRNGHLEVVKYLLQNGAEIHADDDRALTSASSYGHLEIVKYLLENGADIHGGGDYALRWASNNGHLEVVKYLIQNGADIHAEGDLALRWASEKGRLDVVKYLVENKANIHVNNDEALRLAIQNGRLEVVKYLIQKGANINKNYAIKLAIEHDHIEIAEYLLSLKK